MWVSFPAPPLGSLSPHPRAAQADAGAAQPCAPRPCGLERDPATPLLSQGLSEPLGGGHGAVDSAARRWAALRYAVHYLYATLNLPPRVIAEQMGWSLGAVLDLLAVYGHGDVGALDEIDRAFATNVRPLRLISDASQTQEDA